MNVQDNEQANLSAKTIVNTKLTFLKIIFGLWLLFSLIKISGSSAFFGFEVQGVSAIVVNLLNIVILGMLLYGIFTNAKWAWLGSLLYVAILVIINIAISLIFYEKNFLTPNALVLVIFALLFIDIYRNKKYFSGKGNVVYQKSTGKMPWWKMILIDFAIAILLIILIAAYVYFSFYRNFM